MVICARPALFTHSLTHLLLFFKKGVKAPTKYADTRCVVSFYPPPCTPRKDITIPRTASPVICSQAQYHCHANQFICCALLIQSHPTSSYLTSTHRFTSPHLTTPRLTSPHLIPPHLKFARPALFLITHRDPPTFFQRERRHQPNTLTPGTL